MRRGLTWLCWGVLGLGFGLWLTALLRPDPLITPAAGFVPSIIVTDREGRPLRQLLTPEASRSRWSPLAAMSPHLIHAALAAEEPMTASVDSRDASGAGLC